MDRKAKVLYLLHDHPSLDPGGPADYALELYEAMRASDEVEPTLVARTGSEGGLPRRHRPGTPFSSLNEDPNQYLVLIEKEGFDFFLSTYGEKSLYVRYFADFLRALEPDIVHFQQPTSMGCELISLVRNLMPSVPIVYTLHDYSPICHRDGRLVRTLGEALCFEESPRRCHECFPEISDEDFFLRKRFIATHFGQVDVFLAPTRFLLERYAEWGIPREKIRLEDLGRRPALPVPESQEDRPRTRFGYFGKAGPYAGLDVLLAAMEAVAAEPSDVHLWLHAPAGDPDTIGTLTAHAPRNVTLVDGFDSGRLPELMTHVDWVVVPARWPEGSPVAIQEAFLHGRPVICSAAGGMAEKMTDGVNGLSFAVGDARELAETICRAAGTPGLWAELRRGIPAVPTTGQHVERLTSLYRECLERPARADAQAVPK